MSCSQYSGSGCTTASCLLKYSALTFTALIKVNSMFVTIQLSIYNILPQLGTVLMCENIFRYHRIEKRAECCLHRSYQKCKIIIHIEELPVLASQQLLLVSGHVSDSPGNWFIWKTLWRRDFSFSSMISEYSLEIYICHVYGLFIYGNDSGSCQEGWCTVGLNSAQPCVESCEIVVMWS